MGAHRPIYTLRLLAAPDRDPVRSLRATLKYALRHCGMRCIDVREESAPLKERHDQTDLFPVEHSTRSSAGPIDGLEVLLERPCRHCGATLAIIVEGKGPHNAAATCAGCGCFRQWLARALCVFLLETVVHFGRPTEPVRIFEQVNQTT
jgi:hypothetical protein